MVDRTAILAIVVSVEAVVFLLLLLVLIAVYKFLRPEGRQTNRSSVSEQMITVQERGNSIYRESTYSGNLSLFGRQSFNRGLSLFGRQSFGRGTETFKKYQRNSQQTGLNNQQELNQPPQSSSDSVELQNLQHESPVVTEQEEIMMDQVEIGQIPADDSTY